MTSSWVIIGGGLHGVHVAARLLTEGRVSPERLRIIDPAQRLLERWKTCSHATGMTHLRSSSVHHLDPNPHALRQFAGRWTGPRRFALPYSRPALSLFNAHCDHVISTLGIEALHLQARATSCELSEDRAAVVLHTGERLEAGAIILALGSSEHPYWPSWADASRTSGPEAEGGPSIDHVFDPGFQAWPASAQSVAVVGGGISACQVALRLHREGHEVFLLSRHDVREHQFDSDPGWLGPKLMTGFSREQDLGRRRQMIQGARHRGSIPSDVRRALGRAARTGRLHRMQTEVESVSKSVTKTRLRLVGEGPIDVDRVLLATGFSSQRPGGAMVDKLIELAKLPCASCGFPIVDTQLRWHPRLFVSGPLAELELGPAARNIAGARRAAERIVPVALAASESLSRV